MLPNIIPATLFRHDSCVLGEGPFWHDGQLWWVDIEQGLLLSADGSGNVKENISFGQKIGAAVPTRRGTLLVALERKIIELTLGTQNQRLIAQPADLPESNRFNDGKCDPRGRWLIGSTSMKGSPKTASLFSLHQDHTLHPLRGNVSISNGLAWSTDGKTMYYIDTMDLGVYAYDYDLEIGSISRERMILRFTEKEGWPDGMAIDRQGRLWIGFWDGSAIRCYHPETGHCEAVVKVPCARPTSCCFGGPNFDRLFITTARLGLTEEELPRQPLAGSLFVCNPGTEGFPTSLFL